jgi:hypothetical protein
LGFRIRKPDEIKAQWREDSKTGLIAFFAISGPLLLIISILPCAYHVLKKLQANNKKINVDSDEVSNNTPPDVQNSLINY